MASPFPGMDPYLEAADIWPDFHSGLSGEIRVELNISLPPPYYARLEVCPEVGMVQESSSTGRTVVEIMVRSEFIRHA